MPGSLRVSTCLEELHGWSYNFSLQRLGVVTHSVSECMTGNSLADSISMLIAGHTAHEESRIKSARVTSGKRRSMLSGVFNGVSAPYGYRKLPKQNHEGRFIRFYEPDPARAAIVDEIFTTRADHRRRYATT